MEFASLARDERKEYLAARLHNLRSRVRHLMGRGTEEMEDVPFADTHMNERIENSWANHMQARRAYRTTAVSSAGATASSRSSRQAAWAWCSGPTIRSCRATSR